jgi:PAS domain S-box-containing protein
MWLQQVDCEAIRMALQHSPSMYLASKSDGTILWANDAFCEWSEYTLPELTRLSWLDISQKDESLDVDVELANSLGPYNLSYRIQKRYIPKNGKPQIGNLTVTRYPATGEISFCWCRWEPLTNGTAQAFELALESAKTMSNQLAQLTTEVKQVTARTDEENLVISLIRMCIKHPRIALGTIVLILTLGGFDTILGTLQKLGYIPAPPVVVKEVSK